ncbi:hypothetical protein L7F22_039722 [Adiantum nelumboides]|nr:hypothetical protein [Adiantum nelumboides]
MKIVPLYFVMEVDRQSESNAKFGRSSVLPRSSSDEQRESIVPAGLDSILDDDDDFELTFSLDVQQRAAAESLARSRQVLRSEEYRQLFHLPPEEVLIQDFNCALQKKILLQGHMYLFEHYVCFYSNIFGYEKKKIIVLKDVTSVRKARTAGLFPNAIEIVAWGKKRIGLVLELSCAGYAKLGRRAMWLEKWATVGLKVVGPFLLAGFLLGLSAEQRMYWVDGSIRAWLLMLVRRFWLLMLEKVEDWDSGMVLCCSDWSCFAVYMGGCHLRQARWMRWQSIQLGGSCGRSFFASFLSRDEAYRLIVEGWSRHSRNAVMDSETQSNASAPTNHHMQAAHEQHDVCVSESSFESRDNAEAPSEQTVDAEVPTGNDDEMNDVDTTEVSLPLVDSSSSSETRDANIPEGSPSKGGSSWEVEDEDAPRVPQQYKRVLECELPVDVKDFFQFFFSDDSIKFCESFHKKCGDEGCG